MSTVHAVMSIWSECDCVIIAQDPTTRAGLQLWDIRRVQTFSVEFHPRICLTFNLQHANDPPVTQENIVELPSVRAAEELFFFFECLVKRDLPRVFASLERREVRASDEAKPTAILYGATHQEILFRHRQETEHFHPPFGSNVGGDPLKTLLGEEDEYMEAPPLPRKLVRRLFPSKPMDLPPSALPPQIPARDILRPGVPRRRAQDKLAFNLI